MADLEHKLLAGTDLMQKTLLSVHLSRLLYRRRRRRRHVAGIYAQGGTTSHYQGLEHDCPWEITLMPPPLPGCAALLALQ